MSRPSHTSPEGTRDAKGRSRGQTLAEFGITISLLLVVLLGIFQVSYLIYQQYVAVNLAREAANIILRPTADFDEAASAIRTALADPQFDSNTRLILSVVQLGTDPGPNKDDPIIMHRHAWGMSTGASALGDPPADAYCDAAVDKNCTDKNYEAKDPANDRRIQAKMPNGLEIVGGQQVYVAEIYRKRRDIVPLAGVPDSLYSVAFF
jgi:hypothetical protein